MLKCKKCGWEKHEMNHTEKYLGGYHTFEPSEVCPTEKPSEVCPKCGYRLDGSFHYNLCEVTDKPDLPNEKPVNPTCTNTGHKFSHCDCEKPSEEGPILRNWDEPPECTRPEDDNFDTGYKAGFRSGQKSSDALLKEAMEILMLAEALIKHLPRHGSIERGFYKRVAELKKKVGEL